MTRKIFFDDDCNDDEELDIDLMHLKFLVSVKENKLLRTNHCRIGKRCIKMMNSETKQLDYILTSGKSSTNHHGLVH